MSYIYAVFKAVILVFIKLTSSLSVPCMFSGESSGKLPPRTCPGCSMPEPYRSHDWALVPANPASKAEY